MTTFTTEDRILAEKDGSYTVNVEGGTVTASPPHIVDSGASVINNEPIAWMDKRTNKCVVFINTPPSDDWIPLYTHPVKELTDEEIEELIWNTTDMKDFARAILRKASEK